MQEAGVAGYETYSVFGLFAPAQPPADIAKKVHDDLTEIIMRPDVKALLAARTFDAEGLDRIEFQKIIDRDTIKWRQVTATATANVKK
jgi:tripartite-type tricarboxylate transporter receptor subunit TctC